MADAQAKPIADAKTKLDLSPAELMSLSAVQNAATLALIPLLLAATSGRQAPRLRRGSGRAYASRPPGGLVAYPLLAPVVFGVDGALGGHLGPDETTRSRTRSARITGRGW